MDIDVAEKILNPSTNLIDVIAVRECWSSYDIKLLRHSIGKSLVYKTKYDPNITREIRQLFIQWLVLDPIHCVVILADSLKKSGEYSYGKLLERFQIRVKSDKRLGRKLLIDEFEN